MGLSDADFWELSFKEFAALQDRHNLAERREYERTAMIMCSIYNVNRAKGAKVIKVEDIIGNSKPKRQSVEQQIALAKQLTLMFGGKINGK